jgi:hypothetical protein
MLAIEFYGHGSLAFRHRLPARPWGGRPTLPLASLDDAPRRQQPLPRPSQAARGYIGFSNLGYIRFSTSMVIVLRYGRRGLEDIGRCHEVHPHTLAVATAPPACCRPLPSYPAMPHPYRDRGKTWCPSHRPSASRLPLKAVVSSPRASAQ